MSVHTPATTTYEPAEVTWRDAVTPTSRASRRRWTACYALLLLLLAASIVDDRFAVGGADDERMPLILIVAVPVVFGMLRRGTRRLTALDHPDLDERDIEARDSAYRIAFPLLVLVMIAALTLLALSLPQAVPGPRHGWFLESQALIGIGLWIALWAVYLPTGALAWREPDALESETQHGGLPEPLRDALLGLALAGAIALSLLAESNTGFLPFVAALTLLGALGRRAAGQPMMSRQRKWRLAIGIVMILVLLAIGLAAGAGGENGDGERETSGKSSGQVQPGG